MNAEQSFDKTRFIFEIWHGLQMLGCLGRRRLPMSSRVSFLSFHQISGLIFHAQFTCIRFSPDKILVTVIAVKFSTK